MNCVLVYFHFKTFMVPAISPIFIEFVRHSFIKEFKLLLLVKFLQNIFIFVMELFLVLLLDKCHYYLSSS